MATFGDGDGQWIMDRMLLVDCFEWSKTLLSKLLANHTILNGEGGLFIKTNNIEIIEGYACLYFFQQTILLGARYKICLVINWTGEAQGESGDKLADVSGVVDVLFTDADKDPDLRVVVKNEGVFGKRFEDAFLAKGKAFVLEKIKVYVDALDKGGVKAKKDMLYEMLKDEITKEEFQRMYMSEKFSRRASDKVGGQISISDGSGTNLELQEGKLIVQKWRFGSWPDGLYSTALVFLFGVVFAILGVFAHLHFGFGGANTTLNFGLFIYWLMYVDRRRQFVRSMCVLAAAFCFGAIASRYYGN